MYHVSAQGCWWAHDKCTLLLSLTLTEQPNEAADETICIFSTSFSLVPSLIPHIPYALKQIMEASLCHLCNCILSSKVILHFKVSYDLTLLADSLNCRKQNRANNDINRDPWYLMEPRLSCSNGPRIAPNSWTPTQSVYVLADSPEIMTDAKTASTWMHKTQPFLHRTH